VRVEGREKIASGLHLLARPLFDDAELVQQQRLLLGSVALSASACR